MSKIYSRAICTIAATKAASSEAGLFSERDSALLEPQALEVQWCWKLRPFGRTDYFQFSPGLYWCDVESLWEEVIEKGPLNRRAWVCQERHLSPRIAHFGEGQLFWECHENRASENYPGGLPGWAMPNWFHDPSSLRKRLFATQTDDPQKSSLLSAQGITATSGPRKLVSTAQQLYDEWTRFRIHYTRSLLTMEGDKLVAIQGVAQQLGTALNDELIAGLWRKNLCAELCWTKHCENDEVRPEPTTWRAPTWSWASSNAIIWPGLFSILHARCLRPEVLCEVDHLDMNINNPLNSEDVPLRLRCTPIDVTLIPELARGISRTYWFHGTIVIQSNMTGIEVGIASEYAGCVHPDRPSWDEIMHLQMIVTRRCVHTSDNPSQENLGIGTQVIREGEQHNSSSDDNDDAGKDHDLQENSRLEGLLLEKQHEQDEVYKRVGTFSINACSAISQISMKHDAHESKVITLL